VTDRRTDGRIYYS